MSSGNESRNDVAWAELFQKHQILRQVDENGRFCITSQEINKIREARLMTKFDALDHLPSLFQENRLSILPISRGEYVIAKADSYYMLESNSPNAIRHLDPPILESLDYENITSEAVAINCAYISRILHDFCGEEDLWLTVSGRMSSGSFAFEINSTNPSRESFQVNVNKAQIEIDGGFEGQRGFYLLEAKNAIPYSFLIRQLYYPYRLWQDKLSKAVSPIFLTYANRIFHLYKYEFTELRNYNSIRLVREQRYSLESNNISLPDIVELLHAVQTKPEPELPLPQADSFERIINLCEILYVNGALHPNDITAIYNFDRRQTNYYTSAGMYLGLIDRVDHNGASFDLSSRCREFFRRTYRNRQLGFVASILEHEIFSQSLNLYLNQLERPSREQIFQIMKNAKLRQNYSDITLHRRTQTVRSWLDWIIGLQSEP